MKFKALQTKREPKEFVHVEIQNNFNMITFYTCDLPYPQPLTADLEDMKEYYKDYILEADSIGFDDMEMIEFEMFEANTVGADIRNKLTSSLNLISLLKVYFKEEDEEKKKKIVKYIKVSMKQSKKSIKYIANLL
jgi:hypothetical protein